MLCKDENRDPGHCLKEGRRVTRCATELYVRCRYTALLELLTAYYSISKLRENCLSEFQAHWNCLEKNNQVRLRLSGSVPHCLYRVIGVLRLPSGRAQAELLCL